MAKQTIIPPLVPRRYNIHLTYPLTTASIVTLDKQFHLLSQVTLSGHTSAVRGILYLSSNCCVTCSDDTTTKVWGCQTGVCLRSLTAHTKSVTSLALHSSKLFFASGSMDKSVIIWSRQTFESLHCLSFPHWVRSLAFGESNTLYVAAFDHGVMSCDSVIGEVGPVVIIGAGRVSDLMFGKISARIFSFAVPHYRNRICTTVPLCKHWTPSTHALWPSSTQHNVHLAVAALWSVRAQRQQVPMPYELLELILMHAMSCQMKVYQAVSIDRL